MQVMMAPTKPRILGVLGAEHSITTAKQTIRVPALLDKAMQAALHLATHPVMVPVAVAAREQ